MDSSTAKNHESQWSTSRFPNGFRVLVLNYKREWVADLEATLTRRNYKGTICASFKEALYLLKEKKLEFDVVLFGFGNSNIGEFEVAEQVAQQVTDLPVIAISNGDEDVMSIVMEYDVDFCVEGPATDRDLGAIWQLVYTRNLLKMKKEAENNTRVADFLLKMKKEAENNTRVADSLLKMKKEAENNKYKSSRSLLKMIKKEAENNALEDDQERG